MEMIYHRDFIRPSLLSFAKDLSYTRIAPQVVRSDDDLIKSLYQISMPYSDRNLILLLYAFGAATMDVMVLLREKDQSLPAGMRKRSATEKCVKRLQGMGYISRWICYRKVDGIKQVLYDFYTVSETLAKHLSKKNGIDLSKCCGDAGYTPSLLSAAQLTALCMDTYEGVPEKELLSHGVLQFSQMPYFKLRYRDYWTLNVFSVRNGLKNHAAQLADASALLRGDFGNSKNIAVCDSVRTMVAIADQLLMSLNQSEFYGVYFTDDFSYQDRKLQLMEFYRNADGLQVKPVIMT